tara:strand:+ start:34 stop:429 length:396 start_codon:yes stop_codon:yes gene_type:complete
MENKINKMDRQACGIIGQEALNALKVIAEKYGLTVKQSGGSFNPDEGSFTPKFSFVCETDNGIPSDFARNAPRYGLKAEDWGKTFTSNLGDTYTLYGIKPRNRKYPILGKCTKNGNLYKFGESIVKVIVNS